jgi:hypothetical protein
MKIEENTKYYLILKDEISKIISTVVVSIFYTLRKEE